MGADIQVTAPPALRTGWAADGAEAAGEASRPDPLVTEPSPRRDAAAAGEGDRKHPEPFAQFLAHGTMPTGAAIAARAARSSAPTERAGATEAPLTRLGVERVTDAVRTSLAHGGMEVRLRLHPESLGEVRVAVRWEKGLLSARLEAATPAARDALEGGTQALRASLQEQGIPLDRLSIGVRTDLQPESRDRRAGDQPEPRPEPRAIPLSREDAPSGRAPAHDGRLDIRI